MVYLLSSEPDGLSILKLHTLVTEKPEWLETVIAQQITQIEAEMARMKDEEAKLERDGDGMTPTPCVS